MTNPYEPRWEAYCACGWSMRAYDHHVAVGAANAHPRIRAQYDYLVHPAKVRPYAKEE